MTTFIIVFAIDVALSITAIFWLLFNYNKRFNSFIEKYNDTKSLLIKNDKTLEKDLSVIFVYQKKLNDYIIKITTTVKGININSLSATNANTINQLTEEVNKLKNINTSLMLELDSMTKKYKEANDKLKEDE